MIKIQKEVDFYNLVDELWSGALNTVKTIVENGKSNELMDLLDNLFMETTDIIIINDFLWFDRDYIYEELNIEEEDITMKK